MAGKSGSAKLPGKKPGLFMGEVMECCMCKRKQHSNYHTSSQWTAIEDVDSGEIKYFCPDCFARLLKVKG
jgi:hypothetical protein